MVGSRPEDHTAGTSRFSPPTAGNAAHLLSGGAGYDCCDVFSSAGRYYGCCDVFESAGRPSSAEVAVLLRPLAS